MIGKVLPDYIDPPPVRAPFPPADHIHVHRVSATDNWWSLARRYQLADPWDLIEYNFRTRDAKQTNWYLENYVGCNTTTPDQKNYSFSGTETSGLIYIPPFATIPSHRPDPSQPILPPGKQTHPQSCWAAALSWWSRRAKGRTRMSEERIMDEYYGLWNYSGNMEEFGGLPLNKLGSVWGDTRWRTSISKLSTLTRDFVLSRTTGLIASSDSDYAHDHLECLEMVDMIPMLIGYKDKRVGGPHANVVWVDPEFRQLRAMDPAIGYVWRDPGFYGSGITVACANEYNHPRTCFGP